MGGAHCLLLDTDGIGRKVAVPCCPWIGQTLAMPLRWLLEALLGSGGEGEHVEPHMAKM